MIKCRNCKYWNKSNQIFHDDLYACCDAITDGYQHTEREKKAYIADCGEGVEEHSFHTQEDFSCNLFEYKGN